jgi:inosine/xanthosine triphosphate pyrophosphatase family protein
MKRYLFSQTKINKTMDNKMIDLLIRAAMFLSVMGVTVASSDTLSNPLSIDLEGYAIRENQPDKGTIYDPIDKTKPYYMAI